MPARPYVTLHAPMPRFISEPIVELIAAHATKYGLRYWVDRAGEDMVVMIDVPEVWTQRTPTPKELEIADQLLADGQMDKFRDIVQRGLPPAMR